MLDKHLSCSHCHSSIQDSNYFSIGEHIFCCRGCKTVFGILQDNNMQSYYSLLPEEGAEKPDELKVDYTYLDQFEFAQEYIKENSEGKVFRFYLEGVHCAACLWLLEKIKELDIGVTGSQLSMADSSLTVFFKREAKLSKIAETLQSLGYKPHPILHTEDQESHQRRENQRELRRLGIAFACAGNIMLYSLAVYFGAPGSFAKYFNLFSFLCTLPIIFYCAIPFYKTALASFKLRELSVDVPIVLVLILAFIAGLVSFFSSFELYYFDTISTLVFLLLGSRYLLGLVQKKAMIKHGVFNQYFNKPVQRIEGEIAKTTLAKYLRQDDHFKLYSGEVVPTDSQIIKGVTYIDNGIITGESDPIEAREGDSVKMGAINIGDDIELVVEKTVEDSQVGQFIKRLEEGWADKSSFSRMIDMVSKYFSIIVISLASAFFIFFYWNDGFITAVDRSFSLLLITCPCALALATPLAMSLGLNALFKQKVYVKSSEGMEKVVSAKEIFFDKTGTLTTGQFEVTLPHENIHLLNILYSLERRSEHPIAKSICRKLEEVKGLEALNIKNYLELPGEGVSGTFNNRHYKVRALAGNDEKNEIGLFEEEELLLQLEVEDEIQSSAKQLIASLKRMGKEVFILSGDKRARVMAIAKRLGISTSNCYYSMKPEDKKRILEEANDGMMVGDGSNDAFAIRNSLVGVSIGMSNQLSLEASDIYINGDVQLLRRLFHDSLYSMKVLRRSLVLSLIYNSIGVYLAAAGLVSPLLAAIFMPISSLSVILFILLSFSKWFKD